MSITGHPGQGPIRVGIAINDTSAGLLLANGITLALLGARAHRRGAMGPHLAARGADLHARLPGLALHDEGRGRQAGGQFPPDLARHRHVPDRRRLHQHRRLGRQSVEEVLRGVGRQGSGAQPRFRHRAAARQEPAGADRASQRRRALEAERVSGSTSSTRPACRAARSTRSTRSSPTRRSSISASAARSTTPSSAPSTSSASRST